MASAALEQLAAYLAQQNADDNGCEPAATLTPELARTSLRWRYYRRTCKSTTATEVPSGSIAVGWAPTVYALPAAESVRCLPSFTSGELVGVDAASIFAVQQLQLRPGQKVLDVCCAPGGKLTYAAEAVGPKGVVLGVDVSAHRLDVCRKLIRKLDLQNALIYAADATCIDLRTGDVESQTAGERRNTLDGILQQQAKWVEAIGGSWNNWRMPHDVLRKKRGRNRKYTLSVQGRRELQRLLFSDSHPTEKTNERVVIERLSAERFVADRVVSESVVIESVAKERAHYEITNSLIQTKGADYGEKGPRLLFDRVIVDAECTHDGSPRHLTKFGSLWGWETFSRRVLDEERCSQLTTLQYKLLQVGFSHLKTGGLLLYSTCSMSSAQNEAIVRQLLQEHLAARVVPITHVVSEEAPQIEKSQQTECSVTARDLAAFEQKAHPAQKQLSHDSPVGLYFRPGLTSGLFMALLTKQ